ncbi:MBL fold metallo-hydrolase [Patescibacteria group bacterium]|nr:MBL fold metallo-hydrolase [Patescibacteria group bacterium]
MEIAYLGHASFKFRGKTASVVSDPFDSSIGFSLSRVSGDIVTVSHGHQDHKHVAGVSGTTRRAQPFVIDAPGEYEVSGISVFGTRTFHDDEQGAKRGENVVFVIHVDDVAVAHLGDLGHVLGDSQVEDIGEVDVLCVPVGGVITIGPKEAIAVINQLQPAIVLPMHYRTERHTKRLFGDLAAVDVFLNEGGYDQARRVDKLTLTKQTLPEETEVVVLK